MKIETPKDPKEPTGEKNEREKPNPLKEVGHHLVLFIGLFSLGILSN